ncbi:MSP7-like protein, putative [Plasmodium sp. gorilla clade G2]|uniref:MSP7-like protein, putative n=1 Tax=Plasmodium sp. gorilla clade G2 TaxID=880535 RepID=UPI000D27CD59|nr:MSP7-like protein, putative [Plasmodium sp. gorilla clade G2]SOV20108.1 MSP7-like protein, putative [Plasmodium sp. gorilla clade G2]
MKRQIILFTSLFIFSFNLTWSYEKSNIRSGYYNEENLNNKEKNKTNSLFNEINEDVQNDVEKNLDSEKNVLEGDDLFIGQAGEEGSISPSTGTDTQRSGDSATTNDKNTNGASGLSGSTELREGGTTGELGTGSGPKETQSGQSGLQSGQPGSQASPVPGAASGPQGTQERSAETGQGAVPSVPQQPSPANPSASEQPQAVLESSSQEGTSPQSRTRRSTESDQSSDNGNNTQTPVSTIQNSKNVSTSPQTTQPRNTENNRVNRIPEMKYLDLLYDELLTNSEGKHQVDFGENHEKYNIFRKDYDNFAINQKEYDIIKKLLNSLFTDNDENEKMKKLASIFQKALIDKEFHDQFKNFIDGILGFAKRHSYLGNEKIQNNAAYKAFFQNAVDLLNTL